MKFRWQQLIPIVALGCALPAMAAREFTPQAGLWMIPSENNGQPGRGFSLDVQGNTAFLQVFNYEKSGAATFHTAVGKLDDAASMTVPLLRFKGGRSFGGPAQDAVEDGSAGNVTVKFTDGLNGSIQFPGESEQPIARFLVPEKLPYWWSRRPSNPSWGSGGFRSMHWTATSRNGIRYAWEAQLQADTDGVFPLSLTSKSEWGDFIRTFSCQLQTDTEVFDCLPLANSINGEAADLPLEIQRLRFTSVGRDVVGEIQPAWDLPQRITVNGWVLGSFSCQGLSCTEPSKDIAQVYSTDLEELEQICITGGCFGYGAATLIPSNGAWMIESERTGKPGRGVFLDVQNDTIIMQTSDYQANGEPTFHLGASSLQDNRGFDKDAVTSTAMLLRQYANGRYFGGPAQSGIEVGNAGELRATFAKYYDGLPTDFATGDVALPNEGLARMRRLNMEPANTFMERALGEYLLNWGDMGGVKLSWVRLNRMEGNEAVNDDGSVRCTNLPARGPNWVRCIWSRYIGSVNSKNHADFELRPFGRYGNQAAILMQTRDSHGNWLGLGKVNLPGLAIPAD